MASVTIKLTAVCAGGGHFTFGVTGDKTATVRSDLSDMLAPLSDEEAIAFVKAIAKLAKVGRTNAQAKALLQAGVTVTV